MERDAAVRSSLAISSEITVRIAIVDEDDPLYRKRGREHEVAGCDEG
jgi:hypothetical protein